MIPFQVALEAALASFSRVEAFMETTTYAWGVVESIHFIGLTLLLGSIAAWDLRLVGVMRDVPAAAFHHLILFAVLGFGINVSSGLLFLMTDPDQYVYNSAFHLKLFCLALAGINVLVFYLTMFRHVKSLGPGAQPPPLARLNGVVSLVLWVTVIVCGRMITFYRPNVCQPGQALGVLANCIVR